MPTLTLYSKPGCRLCDDNLPMVERLALRHGFDLEKVNIEDDPELLERHRYRIPVLELDGVELGWGRLSERALTKRLAETGGS